MKTKLCSTIRLLAVAFLLAAHAFALPLRAADDAESKSETESETERDILAKAELSATETVRVAFDHDSRVGDEGFAIFILRGGERKRLPAIPESLDTTQKAQWVFAPPRFQFSSDGKWLFGVQKVSTGYCVGCLYEHAGGAAYKVATKTRFDALAWRTFAKKEGTSVEGLLASQSLPHLIDCVLVGNRYVAVSLRGAIPSVPKSKKVPRDEMNKIGATGIYDWRCLYDLKTRKFLTTPGIDAFNKNAWKRWHDDGSLWLDDGSKAVEAAEKQLVTTLEKEAKARFEKAQAEWRSEHEPTKSEQEYLDALRSRAMDLEMQLLDLSSR